VKKQLILFLFLSLYSTTNYSQNLIIDGSFEYPTSCPIFQDNITVISGCFPVSITPNIFNSCCNYVNLISASSPYNFFGNQYPRTGNGYSGLGIGAFGIDMNDSIIHDSTWIFDELIGVSLKSTLIANKKYCARFYVSLGNRRTNIAMDGMSMLITSDSIPELHWEPLLDTVLMHYPQMEHPQINNPSGNIIDDTLNWVKVEGEFVAQGDEKFLYIGNFKRLKDIHWKIVPYTDFLGGTEAYYYIDDVSVYPCDAPVYRANAGKDTCINSGESVTLGEPSRDEYLYWWSDGVRTISTNGSITVSPTQTTTYYLVQKDFKFDETRDSVTITVGNCETTPNYSHFDFEIYPNPTNGEVNVRFNTKVPIGATMQLYDMLGQKVAEFPLTSTTNIATVNFGELATAVYHATVVVPDIFRKSVKLVVLR